MTVFSLVQSNIVDSRSSKSKERVFKQKKSRKLLAVFMISVISIFLFIYFLEANSIVAKGYEIRELKKKLSQLQEEHQVIQIEVSKLKSINNLQEKTQNLDMVKAQNIEYVNISSSKVVER